jgi:hypothetical protein
MESGSEVEIRVDVFTGEVTNLITLKGTENDENLSSLNQESPGNGSLSRSRPRRSSLGRKQQDASISSSPQTSPESTSSFSSPSPSPNVSRFSITDAGILGSIKLAIGMAKEEATRKIYFTIPQDVLMGDSVLVITPPTHEDTIDANLAVDASRSDLNAPPPPGAINPRRRQTTMKLSDAFLGTNHNIPTKYPAVQAESVEIAPVHPGCDVLRSHHRNRRKTAEAFFNLGVMYTTGKGLKFDQTKAVNAWEVAAAMGHAQAQNNLGIMYANGDGVKRNDTRAVEMYMKA